MVITVRKDGEEDAPAVRSKDYKDKAEVYADVDDIMRFITNYIG